MGVFLKIPHSATVNINFVYERGKIITGSSDNSGGVVPGWLLNVELSDQWNDINSPHNNGILAVQVSKLLNLAFIAQVWHNTTDLVLWCTVGP